MRFRVAVLILVVGLGASGCLFKKKKPVQPAPQVAAPAPAPVRLYPPPVRLYYDADGGIRDSVRLVVRDAATLASTWTDATSRQPDPPPAPTFDFSKEMMLVAAAGQVPADEEIRVDSVYVQRTLMSDGKTAEVLVIVVKVVEGCPGTRGTAYPVYLARVHRFDGPVRWDEERVTPRCRDLSVRPADPGGPDPGPPAGPRWSIQPGLPAPAGRV